MRKTPEYYLWEYYVANCKIDMESYLNYPAWVGKRRRMSEDDKRRLHLNGS
jgi:hypothetical protein